MVLSELCKPKAERLATPGVAPRKPAAATPTVTAVSTAATVTTRVAEAKSAVETLSTTAAKSAVASSVTTPALAARSKAAVKSAGVAVIGAAPKLLPPQAGASKPSKPQPFLKPQPAAAVGQLRLSPASGAHAGEVFTQRPDASLPKERSGDRAASLTEASSLSGARGKVPTRLKATAGAGQLPAPEMHGASLPAGAVPRDRPKAAVPSSQHHPKAPQVAVSTTSKQVENAEKPTKFVTRLKLVKPSSLNASGGQRMAGVAPPGAPKTPTASSGAAAKQQQQHQQHTSVAADYRSAVQTPKAYKVAAASKVAAVKPQPPTRADTGSLRALSGGSRWHPGRPQRLKSKARTSRRSHMQSRLEHVSTASRSAQIGIAG